MSSVPIRRFGQKHKHAGEKIMCWWRQGWKSCWHRPGNTQGCQQTPEARRNRKDALLQVWGGLTLLIPWSWTCSYISVRGLWVVVEPEWISESLSELVSFQNNFFKNFLFLSFIVYHIFYIYHLLLSSFTQVTCKLVTNLILHFPVLCSYLCFLFMTLSEQLFSC